MSSRRNLVDAIRTIARSLRAGAYHVRRGPVNWTVFDFGSKKRGLAIAIEDAALLNAPMGKDATIRLELMAPVDDGDEESDIDDGLMDDLVEDAEQIIDKLANTVDSQGDPVALRIDNRSARVVEVVDFNFGVQGIFVHFEVTF